LVETHVVLVLVLENPGTRTKNEDENESLFMESHFETGIENLRQKLLVMASLTEKSVNDAVQALTERDHDLAVRVKAEDDLIDQCEVEIDE